MGVPGSKAVWTESDFEVMGCHDCRATPSLWNQIRTEAEGLRPHWYSTLPGRDTAAGRDTPQPCRLRIALGYSERPRPCSSAVVNQTPIYRHRRLCHQLACRRRRCCLRIADADQYDIAAH